jgi:sRNA-binding protein
MQGKVMSSKHQTDRNRGSREARQQLAVLREKWPLAFPAEPKDVRPLAIGAAGEIASSMRWSLPYTLGVLANWKMAPPYCNAVLCDDHRVALDGSLSSRHSGPLISRTHALQPDEHG